MGKIGSPAPLLVGGLPIGLDDEVAEQVSGENEQERDTHVDPCPSEGICVPGCRPDDLSGLRTGEGRPGDMGRGDETEVSSESLPFSPDSPAPHEHEPPGP